MKRPILKLNSAYFPVALADYRECIKNIFSGTAFPMDIEYSQDENGDMNIESMLPVKTWDEWKTLPVREYDDFLGTTGDPVRLPPIVVCSDYSKIRFKRVVFPTNRNIWNRDENICQYTGVKLKKSELSVDHIIPTSRGGEDTWLNKVTCDRELNSRKGDKTPEEAGLKLIKAPTVPKMGGLVFPKLRPEWKQFVSS